MAHENSDGLGPKFGDATLSQLFPILCLATFYGLHNNYNSTMIDVSGGLNTVLAKTLETAGCLKLNLITNTVVAKSAWMKPCIYIIIAAFEVQLSMVFGVHH